MFYTHPFGGLISIFAPTVYEALTLDMKIKPFPYMQLKNAFQLKAKGHKDEAQC